MLEEPFPGEEVSESPLDELAEVTPEIVPEELEKERELVTAGPPTFDIPMVTNDKVMFWVDYYSNRHRDSFRPGLVRGGRYLPLFRRIFEEEGLPRIVRTKRFQVAPMDEEEAVEQMELLGHDFFVFFNVNTNEVNVIYRRKDGNYGLIEPELA